MGTGGTKHHFEEQFIPKFELVEKEISNEKGGLIGTFQKGKFHFEFKSVNGDVLDSFEYPLQTHPALSLESPRNLTLLVFGAVLFLAAIYILCYLYFKKKQEERMELELESIKPQVEHYTAANEN